IEAVVRRQGVTPQRRAQGPRGLSPVGRIAVTHIIYRDHQAVDQGDMKQVIEQGDPPEDHEKVPECAPRAVNKTEYEDGRAKRHEHEKNRWRIFLAVDEGQDGEERIVL